MASGTSNVRESLLSLHLKGERQIMFRDSSVKPELVRKAYPATSCTEKQVQTQCVPKAKENGESLFTPALSSHAGSFHCLNLIRIQLAGVPPGNTFQRG